MDYDIAVIGGGPAGATFARLFAGSGKKILLIDGQSDETKKPCGGLLAPDAQRILAHFDLTLPKSVLVDPQIFSVKTMDIKSGLTRYYQRHYLNMDRLAFDRWLLSLVPESVDIISGRCTRVQRVSEGFSLRLALQGEERKLTAAILVGADGAASIVRRSFFRPASKSYVAIQQWFRALDENPFYSCVFDPETSDSCSWSIHKDGYFIFGGCFRQKGSREAFEQQKRNLSEKAGFDFGEPVKTEACMALSPRRMSDFCTGEDGVYLIGEAAGFISPSSFEGISSAILSGSLLARALEEKGGAHAEKLYARLCLSLKLRLRMKAVKRWFMYTPITRFLIMKSGLRSITPMLR